MILIIMWYTHDGDPHYHVMTASYTDDDLLMTASYRDDDDHNGSTFTVV